MYLNQKIITGYIKKCTLQCRRRLLLSLSAECICEKLPVSLNEATFAMRLWTPWTRGKVSANYRGTSETKVPFSRSAKKLFCTVEELHVPARVRRVVNFWRNKVTSVTLFHSGCVRGKNIIRFMKNKGSRWSDTTCLALSCDWREALLFVRQCCHLQADLRIDPLRGSFHHLCYSGT